MFDTSSASKGVKFALLEGQLLAREIDRTTFVGRAADLGLPAAAVAEAADKFVAIAANQAARRADLRSSYDYIVDRFRRVRLGRRAAPGREPRRAGAAARSRRRGSEARHPDHRDLVLQPGRRIRLELRRRAQPKRQQSLDRPGDGQGPRRRHQHQRHGLGARPQERFRFLGQAGRRRRLGLPAHPRHLPAHRGLAGRPRSRTPRQRRRGLRPARSQSEFDRAGFPRGRRSRWASPPSPTRTASCRKVRAARRSPTCASATAAG